MDLEKKKVYEDCIKYNNFNFIITFIKKYGIINEDMHHIIKKLCFRNNHNFLFFEKVMDYFFENYICVKNNKSFVNKLLFDLLKIKINKNDIIIYFLNNFHKFTNKYGNKRSIINKCLIWSSKYNNELIVKYLVDNFYKYINISIKRYSAIKYAIKNDNYELVKYLWDKFNDKINKFHNNYDINEYYNATNNSDLFSYNYDGWYFIIYRYGNQIINDNITNNNYYNYMFKRINDEYGLICFKTNIFSPHKDIPLQKFINIYKENICKKSASK